MIVPGAPSLTERASIDVRSAGVAARLVDRGVPGRARLGASRGGAVDLAAHDLNCRLLGNPGDAASLETSGSTTWFFRRPATIVVTGGLPSLEVTDGPAIGWGTPVTMPPGAVLRIGRVLDGARVYVGVRGGLVVCADGLGVGAEPLSPGPGVTAPRPVLAGEVRVWNGPRTDWFGRDGWSALTASPFVVTDTSRVGVRLSGAPIVREVPGELPSEGMIEGSVQVPPDGCPIVMLADHPVTGGYPVIGVVDPADLWEIAQAAVGSTLRFRNARR